jgi:hypothetical protein
MMRETSCVTLQIPPGAVVDLKTPVPISPFTGHHQHAHLGSVEWDVVPINNFRHYLDEILVHTLSYLDTRSLLKAGKVCNKWQKLSSHDIIWKTRYETLTQSLTDQGIQLEPPTNNFKQAYIGVTRRYYYMHRIHQLYNGERTLFYGLIATFIPCLAFGSIIATVLAGLFFDSIIDKSIASVALTLIPYLLLFVFPYALLLICCVLYYRVLSPQRSKFYWKLRTVGEMDGNRIHDLNEDVVMTIADSTVLVCLWFAWLAILPACLYVGYLAPGIPYRALFSPVYLMGVIYIVAPPIGYVATARKRQARFREFTITAYVIGVILYTILSVQIGLIGAKLDGAIDLVWLLVAVPYWANAGLWIIVPPILILFIFKYTNAHKRLKIGLVIMYFGAIVVTPFSIFATIHFSTTLDAIWGGRVAFSFSASLVAVYFTIFAITALITALTIYLARPKKRINNRS